MPRATGTIRTRDGRFDAYGQQLEIERGILSFQGLLDNPAIDARADPAEAYAGKPHGREAGEGLGADNRTRFGADSLTLVDGTEIDFLKQGLNEQFVFRNPNVKGECGCGESFTTDAAKAL